MVYLLALPSPPSQVGEVHSDHFADTYVRGSPAEPSTYGLVMDPKFFGSFSDGDETRFFEVFCFHVRKHATSCAS
jgi:hypothetical protein